MSAILTKLAVLGVPATVEFTCVCKSLVELAKLANLVTSSPLVQSHVKSLTVKLCKLVSPASVLSILEKSPSKDMVYTTVINYLGYPAKAP